MPDLDRKIEMIEYMGNFRDMPDRLLKYNEILLEGEDASPYCYQDTMSYRRLAVALTTRCNLLCKWCYRLDPHYKDILNKDLDFSKYRKFVENTEGKFRMVHLGGLGEPTLYRKIREVIQLSKRLSENVKLTTNGVISPDDIDAYCAAGLTYIEISIDAFDGEKLKEYRGVDLDRLAELVCYISNETPLHLQINSVVSTENRTCLKDMVTAFKKAPNIDVWHTIPLFETAQMRQAGIRPLSVEEYQDLLLDLARRIEKAGLNWKLSPTAYGVRLDPVIEMKRRRNICFSCFEDPYIGVTGTINFCSRREELGSEADISVGFEKAWNHPSLTEFRKNMLIGRYPEHCGKMCFLKERTAEKVCT